MAQDQQTATQIFSQNEYIFSEREPSGGRIFYLLEGAVALQRGHGEQAMVLREIKDREFFGLVGAMTGNDRAISARVITENAHVLTLTKDRFLATTVQNAQLGLELCQHASKRYTHALIELARQSEGDTATNIMIKIDSELDLNRRIDLRDFVNNLPVLSYFENDMVYDDAQFSQRKLCWVSDGTIELRMFQAGQPILTTELATGNFFGAISLLAVDSLVHTKAKATSQRARVRYLTEEKFLDLCAKEPIFLYSLLKIILEGTERVEMQIRAGS